MPLHPHALCNACSTGGGRMAIAICETTLRAHLLVHVATAPLLSSKHVFDCNVILSHAWCPGCNACSHGGVRCGHHRQRHTAGRCARHTMYSIAIVNSTCLIIPRLSFNVMAVVWRQRKWSSQHVRNLRSMLKHVATRPLLSSHMLYMIAHTQMSHFWHMVPHFVSCSDGGGRCGHHVVQNHSAGPCSHHTLRPITHHHVSLLHALL